ncbi:MAG: T9SS type A sorting domain-containing protein [Chitinophagales bacterium]|nr:T9SS type A sorting domain-containing protein [Chitinophagales bacterium]
MKLKFICILSMLLSCPLIIRGQDTLDFVYFNKVYNENIDSFGFSFWNIVPINEEYIAAGWYGELLPNGITQKDMYIQKIDKKGESKWKKVLYSEENITAFPSGNLFILLKNGLLLLSFMTEKETLAGYGDPHLMLLSDEGEVLISKNIGLEYPNVSLLVRQIIEVENGIILMGSRFQEGDSYSRIMLMKTSIFGEVEWLKTYGLAKTSRGFTVQQTTDGGFILGGDAIDEFDNHDMYIVKTDSQGNQQWDKRLGSEETDCAAFANILPDNTYLINGCITNAQGNHKLYLAKLDTNGGLIWEKTYNNLPTYQAFEDLCILEDGGFMATAFKFGTSGTSTELMRFDSDGKILWQKGLHLNEGKDCYLKDIEPTPDGGYVLCGFQYTSPQYSWVVKIDSLGNTCSYTGCDSTYTYINEVTPGVGDEPVVVSHFRVYPNPAENYIYLENSTKQAYIFTMYDLNGKKVLEHKASNSENISLHQLHQGMYFYQFIQNEKAAISGKLTIHKF